MHHINVQCKPQEAGSGGGGGGRRIQEEVKLLVNFFEWEQRINLTNVAKNPTPGICIPF